MNDKLNEFGGYQKANMLYELVVMDMEDLQKNPLCYKLISQQIGSADSICSNIEEGFGRLSTKEYVRFLDIARGSARETRGRYNRLAKWLGKERVAERHGLASEIIGILTKTINTLRRNDNSA